jgi:hypothetical protein
MINILGNTTPLKNWQEFKQGISDKKLMDIDSVFKIYQSCTKGKLLSSIIRVGIEINENFKIE